MTSIDRRTFLTGASVAGVAAVSAVALAACTSPRPSPTATTTVTETPTATGPSTWQALAAAVSGTLLRPSSVGYGSAKQTENPRFDDAAPLGILRAASTSDVIAGLAFCRNSATPLAVRSGGHSYAGWSAGGAAGTGVDPSLVISTAALDTVELSGDGASVTVGPGAPLAAVYEKLAAAGRAIGAGSCGTVAIGGLTLGGGVGVLSRSFGLTCDQLAAVEIVTADGVVHHASATEDADLFWACRGGGGGLVGIVTSMTFTTRPAPTVTMWSIEWDWRWAVRVLNVWQGWAPGASDQLWSTLKLLAGSTHGSTPSLTVSGTWTGSTPLEDELAPFLAAVKATPSSQTAVAHEYGDAMLRYAGCAGEPASACTTGEGGVLKRVSESGTSSMPTVTLDGDAIRRLVAKVEAAGGIVGLTEGGISLDALGGEVRRVAAADTAFPHRTALFSVQYTATFADGADPRAYDEYVRDFRRSLSTPWGDAAYVNYADPSLTSPGQSYFGENLARLTKIKTTVDPKKLFDQPHLLS